MIGDKRGLSTIVVTLIIILLSLVAVGIVWVVVRNIIVGGGAGVQVNSECLNVDVAASNVVCSSGAANKVCNLSLVRTGTGSDVIAGVKLVFRNSTSGVNSALIDSSGDIPQLVGRKILSLDSNITNANGVNSLDVSAYFKDDSGNQQLCSQVNTITF